MPDCVGVLNVPHMWPKPIKLRSDVKLTYFFEYCIALTLNPKTWTINSHKTSYLHVPSHGPAAPTLAKWAFDMSPRD